MVTIAVVGIVMVLALPSFRTFIQNNRITADANRIHTSLMLARSEALKRQLNVYVTANAGGGSGNEFGLGWVVWADLNGDGVYQPASSPSETVAEEPALDSGSTVDASPDSTSVQFKGDGTASAARALRLRIADCSGDQARNIAVSLVGHVDVSRVNCL